jgi:hypothetical protein
VDSAMPNKRVEGCAWGLIVIHYPYLCIYSNMKLRKHSPSRKIEPASHDHRPLRPFIRQSTKAPMIILARRMSFLASAGVVLYGLASTMAAYSSLSSST